MKLRLIPVMLCFCLALLSLKLLDLVEHSKEFSFTEFIPDLAAEDHPESKVTAEAKRAVIEDDDSKEDDPALAHQPDAFKEQEFTEEEVLLLSSLAERRDQLNAWEQYIITKENVLKAMEISIAHKIEELQLLETHVQTLLTEFQTYEDKELRSLIKIYETMKPKDAARIFDAMELPFLLKVVQGMKESKAAPILAKMEVEKVRLLTSQLAKERSLLSNAS